MLELYCHLFIISITIRFHIITIVPERSYFMYHLSNIEVDSNMRSNLKYGSAEFPVLGILDIFSKLTDNKLNWHWHKELEFVLVLKGSVRYYIGEQCILLQEGNGAFINAGTLHSAEPETEPGQTIMFAVVFLPELIMSAQSLIFQNCVAPYVAHSGFPGEQLLSDIPWQKEILSLLAEIKSLEDSPSPLFELKYHNLICLAWEKLIGHLPKLPASNSHGRFQDNARMKLMLEYMHEHFSAEITMEDIAQAANISRSECFRCFRKMIRKTPIEYLTEYRLGHAAEMLATTDKSIAEICLDCGYNHQSYFGKQFKKFAGQTPMEFRKASMDAK